MPSAYSKPSTSRLSPVFLPKSERTLVESVRRFANMTIPPMNVPTLEMINTPLPQGTPSESSWGTDSNQSSTEEELSMPQHEIPFQALQPDLQASADPPEQGIDPTPPKFISAEDESIADLISSTTENIFGVFNTIKPLNTTRFLVDIYHCTSVTTMLTLFATFAETHGLLYKQYDADFMHSICTTLMSCMKYLTASELLPPPATAERLDAFQKLSDTHTTVLEDFLARFGLAGKIEPSSALSIMCASIAIFTVFSGTVLSLKWDWLSKVLANLGKLGTNLRNAQTIYQAFQFVWKHISTWIASLCGYKYVSEEESDILEIKDQLDEAQQLCKDLSESLLKNPAQLSAEMEGFTKLESRMAQIRTILRKMLFYPKQLTNVRLAVDSIVKSYDDFKAYRARYIDGLIPKFEPVCIRLCGPTFVGKSRLATYLMKRIAQRCGKTPSTHVYVNGEGFWSGYNQQFSLLVDEWNQYVDDKDHQEMMKLLSTANTGLEMPELQQKGMKFRSRFIVKCSNTYYVTESKTIKTRDPINRRSDLAIACRNDEAMTYYRTHFRPPDILTMKADGTPFYKEDFSHISFTKFSPLPGATFREGVDVPGHNPIRPAPRIQAADLEEEDEPMEWLQDQAERAHLPRINFFNYGSRAAIPRVLVGQAPEDDLETQDQVARSVIGTPITIDQIEDQIMEIMQMREIEYQANLQEALANAGQGADAVIKHLTLIAGTPIDVTLPPVMTMTQIQAAVAEMMRPNEHMEALTLTKATASFSRPVQHSENLSFGFFGDSGSGKSYALKELGAAFSDRGLHVVKQIYPTSPIPPSCDILIFEDLSAIPEKDMYIASTFFCNYYGGMTTPANARHCRLVLSGINLDMLLDKCKAYPRNLPTVILRRMSLYRFAFHKKPFWGGKYTPDDMKNGLAAGNHPHAHYVSIAHVDLNADLIPVRPVETGYQRLEMDVLGADTEPKFGIVFNNIPRVGILEYYSGQLQFDGTFEQFCTEMQKLMADKQNRLATLKEGMKRMKVTNAMAVLRWFISLGKCIDLGTPNPRGQGALDYMCLHMLSTGVKLDHDTSIRIVTDDVTVIFMTGHEKQMLSFLEIPTPLLPVSAGILVAEGASSWSINTEASASDLEFYLKHAVVLSRQAGIIELREVVRESNIPEVKSSLCHAHVATLDYITSRVTHYARTKMQNMPLWEVICSISISVAQMSIALGGMYHFTHGYIDEKKIDTSVKHVTACKCDEPMWESRSDPIDQTYSRKRPQLSAVCMKCTSPVFEWGDAESKAWLAANPYHPKAIAMGIGNADRHDDEEYASRWVKPEDEHEEERDRYGDTAQMRKEKRAAHDEEVRNAKTRHYDPSQRRAYEDQWTPEQEEEYNKGLAAERMAQTEWEQTATEEEKKAAKNDWAAMSFQSVLPKIRLVHGKHILHSKYPHKFVYHGSNHDSLQQALEASKTKTIKADVIKTYYKLVLANKDVGNYLKDKETVRYIHDTTSEDHELLTSLINDAISQAYNIPRLEATSDRVLRSVLPSIISNTYDLCNKEGEKLLNCIMVKAHTGVTSNHIRSFAPGPLFVKNNEGKLAEIKIRLTNHDRDLLIFTVNPKDMSASRSLIHLIPTAQEAQELLKSPGFIIIPDRKANVNLMNWVQYGTFIKRSVQDRELTVMHYGSTLAGCKTSSAELMTQNGDCGSPLVCLNNASAKKLVGFHTVGAVNYGYGCMIYVEDFDDATLQCAGNFLRPSVVYRDDLIEPCEPYLLPGARQIMVVGKCTIPPFRPTKTSLARSPLHIEHPDSDPLTVPSALHDRDRRLPIKEHGLYLERFLAYEEPEGEVDSEILDRVVAEIGDWYGQTLKEQGCAISVLSRDEAINSSSLYDTSHAMNMSTSAGYPLRQHAKNPNGKAPYILQDTSNDKGRKYIPNDANGRRLHFLIDRILDNASKGVRGFCLYTSGLKEEIVDRKKVYVKGKTRLFQAAPLTLLVPMRQYFHMAVAAMAKCRHLLPGQVGMNPMSIEWDFMMRAFMEISRLGVELDYSDWDATIPLAIMRAIVAIYNRMYEMNDPNWKPEDDIIREGLHQHNLAPIINFNDLVIQLPKGQPSGEALTAPTNCLVNVVITVYTWRRLAIISNNVALRTLKCFRQFVCLKNLGDDTGMAIHESVIKWFNGKTISQSVAVMGLRATSVTDKNAEVAEHIPVENINFLGRCSRKEGQFLVGEMRSITFAAALGWSRIPRQRIDPDFVSTTVKSWNSVAVEASLSSIQYEAALRGMRFYKNFAEHVRLAGIRYKMDLTVRSYAELMEEMGYMTHSKHLRLPKLQPGEEEPWFLERWPGWPDHLDDRLLHVKLFTTIQWPTYQPPQEEPLKRISPLGQSLSERMEACQQVPWKQRERLQSIQACVRSLGTYTNTISTIVPSPSPQHRALAHASLSYQSIRRVQPRRYGTFANLGVYGKAVSYITSNLQELVSMPDPSSSRECLLMLIQMISCRSDNLWSLSMLSWMFEISLAELSQLRINSESNIIRCKMILASPFLSEILHHLAVILLAWYTSLLKRAQTPPPPYKQTSGLVLPRNFKLLNCCPRALFEHHQKILMNYRSFCQAIHTLNHHYWELGALFIRLLCARLPAPRLCRSPTLMSLESMGSSWSRPMCGINSLMMDIVNLKLETTSWTHLQEQQGHITYTRQMENSSLFVIIAPSCLRTQNTSVWYVITDCKKLQEPVHKLPLLLPSGTRSQQKQQFIMWMPQICVGIAEKIRLLPHFPILMTIPFSSDIGCLSPCWKHHPWKRTCICHFRKCEKMSSLHWQSRLWVLRLIERRDMICASMPNLLDICDLILLAWIPVSVCYYKCKMPLPTYPFFMPNCIWMDTSLYPLLQMMSHTIGMIFGLLWWDVLPRHQPFLSRPMLCVMPAVNSNEKKNGRNCSRGWWAWRSSWNRCSYKHKYRHPSRGGHGPRRCRDVRERWWISSRKQLFDIIGVKSFRMVQRRQGQGNENEYVRSITTRTTIRKHDWCSKERRPSNSLGLWRKWSKSNEHKCIFRWCTISHPSLGPEQQRTLHWNAQSESDRERNVIFPRENHNVRVHFGKITSSISKTDNKMSFHDEVKANNLANLFNALFNKFKPKLNPSFSIDKPNSITYMCLVHISGITVSSDFSDSAGARSQAIRALFEILVERGQMSISLTSDGVSCMCNVHALRDFLSSASINEYRKTVLVPSRTWTAYNNLESFCPVEHVLARRACREKYEARMCRDLPEYPSFFSILWEVDPVRTALSRWSTRRTRQAWKALLAVMACQPRRLLQNHNMASDEGLDNIFNDPNHPFFRDVQCLADHITYEQGIPEEEIPPPSPVDIYTGGYQSPTELGRKIELFKRSSAALAEHFGLRCGITSDTGLTYIQQVFQLCYAGWKYVFPRTISEGQLYDIACTMVSHYGFSPEAKFKFHNLLTQATGFADLDIANLSFEPYELAEDESSGDEI